MVRRLWQNRLIRDLLRYPRLFFRWLLIWLRHLLGRLRLQLQGARQVMLLLLRPRDPNNLFVRSIEGAMEAPEGAVPLAPAVQEEDRPPSSLLWASAALRPSPAADTVALSLWRGQRQSTAEEAQAGAAAANRRYAYLDLLTAQIRHLRPRDIALLDELIARLARKWLDVDQVFETYQRRNRLDVRRTLRYNIPRYAGRILTFRWAEKERPVPQLAKPAKLLLIGDVSHSMVHYVSIVLYYFHRLNFFFTVDSYVFSDRATHSAPYLNGLGTFEERVRRLVENAASWNAGTRFGSALAEIAQKASVDENTWVIIATDGKVALKGDEPRLIDLHMRALRSRARSVTFLTPSVDFSGSRGKLRSQARRVGSFRYGFHEIPIYQMGPPLWYGILGQYADRIYLVRTVQDLIDMTENLILAARQA
ncbi:MAG TPA: VWA domain-containing protein [Symbiobacteriaceae bacterium]